MLYFVHIQNAVITPYKWEVKYCICTDLFKLYQLESCLIINWRSISSVASMQWALPFKGIVIVVGKVTG